MLIPLSSCLTVAASPVERVAIIGGGIVGLSLANALLSSNICEAFAPTTPAVMTRMVVDIFELQSGFNYKMSRLGIQLMGGMAMLHQILRKLQRRVLNTVLPLGGVTSRLAKMVIMIRVEDTGA
jgi:hypothetical protein